MKEYKILYTKIINQYPNRPCVYLHGDMSEYNIIFHKDNIFYIDFGNIIYGEAAIDVSIFWARLYISDLLSQSNHSTLFLNTYITNTKDHEIKDFL